MDQLPNISGDPQPDSRTPDRARNRPGVVTMGRALALTATAGLVVGLVVGPIVSGHPALAADPTTGAAEHTVTVSGTGAVSVAPDVADVVLGVQITKPTVAEAQSAAATAMSAVIVAVKKDGVDARDIVTVNLSLSPIYDYNSSPAKLVGQQFVNVVKVTVHDINRVAAVVDDAVSAGATTIQGIAFRVENPNNVATQARQIAMQDARAKADALASSAGVGVKGVASITETSSSTPIYYSGAAMDKAVASTPIQTGTTDVIVNVTVSYLIG
jgi:uncharacterized protein YggE